jgi:hypothetical protein
MKLRRSAIAAVLVVTAAPALACRCRQLKLDEYFDRAEVVFLARALATWVVEEGEGAPGYRAVRFEAEGSPYKGDPSAFEQLATPLSSATCGYAVEVGRVYLVFAAAHEAGDRIAWFDTCNGTRSFDADAPQGVEGFVDVEPKHVLAQLTARRTIAGGSGGPALPLPGDPSAELIGLLLRLRRSNRLCPKIVDVAERGSSLLGCHAVGRNDSIP